MTSEPSKPPDPSASYPRTPFGSTKSDGKHVGGPSHPRALVITAAVLSGLIAFGAGEAIHGRFRPRLVPQNLSGREIMVPTTETVSAADTYNGALTFAILGGCLGLGLGISGVLAGKSIRRGLFAGSLGLVAGALVGAISPLILVPRYFQLQEARNSDDLWFPMAMHAAIWGPLGAIAGLSFGLARGGGHGLRTMVFGLIGACLGTALFEVLGAAVDPLALTSDPVSKTWMTRLLARLILTLVIGLTVAWSLDAPPRRARSDIAPDSPGE